MHILEYVADMAHQLAVMCREIAPRAALALELAARIARHHVN